MKQLATQSPATRFVERDMDAPEVHPLAGGQIVVFSARSPDKPTVNEDTAAVIPCMDESAVIVVADGVGGQRAGEQAAQIAIREIERAADKHADEPHDLREAILLGIEEASRKIAALGVGAAATLAVAEIHGDRVRPYHVGDAMIMAVGQRGRIKLQTISHSPVGYAVESGMLDESEALLHEDRHVVSNLLGYPDMRVEMGSTLVLGPRDTLLLASDGLVDNMSIDEIVSLVRKGPLELGIGRLAAACAERMRAPAEGLPSKPDDLTIAAFRRTPPAR